MTTPNLQALHEAASPAPWRAEDFNGGKYIEAPSREFVAYFSGVRGGLGSPDVDRAFIVALRNAYAAGDLIPRVSPAPDEVEEALSELTAQAWGSETLRAYDNPNASADVVRTHIEDLRRERASLLATLAAMCRHYGVREQHNGECDCNDCEDARATLHNQAEKGVE